MNARRSRAVAHRTRQLLALPLREVLDLAAAQGMLLSALWTIRRRPRGQLLRPVAPPDTAPRLSDVHWITRMATAVDRAARFGLFRPTCLVRAIALEQLLQRAGVEAAAVRVGVQRHCDTLLAHAWIELGGRVIGDDPSRVARFVPLHDFSALSQ